MVYPRKIVYTFAWLTTTLILFGALALGAEPDELAQAHAVMAARLETGVRSMWDGYHDKAIALFTQLEQDFPDHPMGSLRKAEAIWWKIFKTEGDFNKLHDMDVLKTKTPPFENEFNDAADNAMRRAENGVKRFKNSAQAYFALGVANGLKSQMEGGKDHTVAAAKFAKRMRQYLDKALSLDPTLTDAQLELGLYHYYIGSLPPALNMLKFTLGLPAGDKKKGMAMVKAVTDKGGLLAAEAKFYLASIYSSPDLKKYDEAIRLVTELHKEYPNNPTFHLLLGHFYEKAGRLGEARALYNEVLRAGQQRRDNYDGAMVQQAGAALKRCVGGE